MSKKLIEFIDHERTIRGWSHRELARQADISQGSVSGVLSGQRAPSADLCLKIADAFEVPREKMLRLAGFLPTTPENDDDPLLQEIVDIARNLTKQQRRYILSYLHFLYQSGELPDENAVKVAQAAQAVGVSRLASLSAYYAGLNASKVEAEPTTDAQSLHQPLRAYQEQSAKTTPAHKAEVVRLLTQALTKVVELDFLDDDTKSETADQLGTSG